MKKAIFTFGLFSLMMVLTSFTTTVEIGGYHKPKNPLPPANTNYEIGGYHKPKNPLPPASTSYDLGGYHKPKNPLPPVN